MKRLLFVLLAFFALSCGDGSNSRNQTEAQSTEENDDALEDLDDDEGMLQDSARLDNDMERDMETDTVAADGTRNQ